MSDAKSNNENNSPNTNMAVDIESMLHCFIVMRGGSEEATRAQMRMDFDQLMENDNDFEIDWNQFLPFAIIPQEIDRNNMVEKPQCSNNSTPIGLNVANMGYLTSSSAPSSYNQLSGQTFEELNARYQREMNETNKNRTITENNIAGRVPDSQASNCTTANTKSSEETAVEKPEKGAFDSSDETDATKPHFD